MATDAILSVVQAASIGAQPLTAIPVAIAEALAVKKIESSEDDSTLTIADAIQLQNNVFSPLNPFGGSLSSSLSLANSDSFINPFQYLEQDEDARKEAEKILNPTALTEAEGAAISSAKLLESMSLFLQAFSALDLSSAFSSDILPSPLEANSSTSSDSFNLSNSSTFGDAFSDPLSSSSGFSFDVFSSFGADSFI